MPKRNRSYTRWFEPYYLIEDKRLCNLATSGSGVYIIKEKDIVVYIGRSKSDVKKTLYRHFQVKYNYKYKKIIKSKFKDVPF